MSLDIDFTTSGINIFGSLSLWQLSEISKSLDSLMNLTFSFCSSLSTNRGHSLAIVDTIHDGCFMLHVHDRHTVTAFVFSTY